MLLRIVSDAPRPSSGGDIIRCRWFCDGQLTGELKLRMGEWQIIGAALLLGAAHTGPQHLLMQFEGWTPGGKKGDVVPMPPEVLASTLVEERDATR